MASFARKARDFEDAQAFAKSNPTPAGRRALAEAAAALKQSPEVARARREHNGKAQQQSIGYKR